MARKNGFPYSIRIEVSEARTACHREPLSETLLTPSRPKADSRTFFPICTGFSGTWQCTSPERLLTLDQRISFHPICQIPYLVMSAQDQSCQGLGGTRVLRLPATVWENIAITNLAMSGIINYFRVQFMGCSTGDLWISIQPSGSPYLVNLGQLSMRAL